jgi:polar amino acid transport system substrate-binding protein
MRIRSVILFWLIALQVSSLAAEDVTLGSGFWAILSDAGLPDQGSMTKLVKDAYASVGVSMTRVEMPWARVLASINATPAAIDGGYPFGKTAAREATFLFSDPVGSATRYIYFNTDKPFDWESVEDMKGLRIGIVRGTAFGAYHEQLNARIKADPEFATIDPAKDDLANFRKLAAGRIDICFCDENQARHAIAQLPAADGAKIRAAAKPIMDTQPLFVLFRKDERGKRLRDLLNAGLKKALFATGRRGAADAAE